MLSRSVISRPFASLDEGRFDAAGESPFFINHTSETSVPQPPVLRQTVTSDFNPDPTPGCFFIHRVNLPSLVAALGMSNSKKSARYSGSSRFSANG